MTFISAGLSKAVDFLQKTTSFLEAANPLHHSHIDI
jgi:hypothetical protein